MGEGEAKLHMSYSQQEMEEFFATEYPHLYQYAVYLTRDQETAQDLCQETFIRWFNQNGQGEVDYPRAWLKKVLSNLAMNHFRHQKVRMRIESFPPDDEEGVTTMDQELVRIEVNEVLSGLPWRDQMLLKMKMAGLSYTEIAEAMDVSVGSVGTMLARAMKRFKILYEGKEVQNYEMSGRRHAFPVS